MTPAVEMVERALAAWHQAIIAAPETEEVDARRRRCMRAALSAALEGVDAAIKRLWPNGLGPKNLDELVVFVEEERKCDAEYLANAVKIVQSERATPAIKALEEAIEFALALSQPQGELRAGMVLVPREPTEAMILTQGKSRPDLAKTDGIRNVAQELNEIVRADAVRIYKEMIDAALAGEDCRMSGLIRVFIDGDTAKRLAIIAHETGREVAELAESAVSEAALEYFRSRNDDPARRSTP
jgi:hypothetical protein